MPQPAHLDPSPYQAEGGRVGALVIHGLTGSVVETRPLGEYLAARGLTVRCPLLPGHGTTPADLTRIHRRAWIEAVEGALGDLRHTCDTLFVAGLSLGSLLTLWLGAHHPDIAGLIVLAPAIKMHDRRLPLTVGARYVQTYAPPGTNDDSDLADPQAAERGWCYDQTALWAAAETYLLQRQVRRLLPHIGQPVLIFQGRRDAALDPAAAQIVYDRIGSADKTLVWLENSGHNVLIDGEREMVWARSYDWLRGRCPA